MSTIINVIAGNYGLSYKVRLIAPIAYCSEWQELCSWSNSGQGRRKKRLPMEPEG